MAARCLFDLLQNRSTLSFPDVSLGSSKNTQSKNAPNNYVAASSRQPAKPRY
jgi:hypothetical protein